MDDRELIELEYTKYKMPNDTIIFSTDISSDGELLAVGQQSAASDKPSLTFWRFTKDGLQLTDGGLCFEEAYIPENIGFCDHDKYLVLNNLVYNFAEKKFKKFHDDNERVEYIKSSQTSPYILASGSEIKIIDIENHNLLWRYDGEMKYSTVKIPVIIANASNDFDKVVISGGDSKEVIVYSASEKKILKRLTGGPDMAGKVFVSDDFKHILVTGYLGHGLFLWDYDSGERILSDLLRDQTIVFAAAFINSNYLVIGSEGGYISIIDINQKCYICLQPIHDWRITSIKINYQKKLMILSSEDGYVSLVDIHDLLA